MLGRDNLQWCISLTLCLLCTNGVMASVIKPDIMVALNGITGLDLTEGDMNKHHIWPQGIIYYYIDDFSFDKVLRDRIRSYLDQISASIGLQFMEIPQPPKDDKSRWVFFLNRKAQLECGDVAFENFTSDGVQKVVLGYDCLKSEDLAEIILSLVGVPPQHNSPDRDDYITVNFDNILPDKHYLFKKMQPEDWMFKKFEYDFASAGHYTSHKHTLNGGETITPKNREIYKDGNKDLSATDIKKVRTTYNYIALKGKSQIKVPECNKLFVTGSNFSNYIPVTKPNKQLTHPEPNHSEDILPDNTKNMSQEINSKESNKPKDSKDIKEETDNKEQTKSVDTNNLKGETDNEVSKEKRFLSNKKLSLLKGAKKKHDKKEMEKLLNKSDYLTDDEGHNKYLNEKQKLNKEVSYISEKKKSLLKGSGKDKGSKKDDAKKLSYASTSVEGKLLNGKEEQSDSPDTPNHNKQKTFLSEKKKLLLKGSGKDNKKKLSHKLDYFTGDEGNNKYLNGKEEHSDSPDTPQLKKQKIFQLEKNKLLFKYGAKDNKKKLSHKLDYFTGDEGNNKYLNGKEEHSDSPDTPQLKKQKIFQLEKNKLLFKYGAKDNKKKLSHKLDYFTGDEGNNKYLNGKEEHSDSPDTPQHKKQKIFQLEKNKLLFKYGAKDNKKKLSHKLDYFTGDEGNNKYLNGKEEQSDSPDTPQLKKQKIFQLEKNKLLFKYGAKDNKKKLSHKLDYFTGDEGNNKYLNGKEEQSDSPDTPQLKKEKNFISAKKKILLKDSGKDKRDIKDYNEKLLLESDYSTGDEGRNKYSNKKEDQSNHPGKQTLNKQKKYILLKNSGKNKRGKNKKKDKLLLQSDYSTGDEGHNNYLKEKQQIHFL